MRRTVENLSCDCDFVPSTIAFTRNIAGRQFPVEAQGERCVVCGREVIDAAQAKEISLHIAEKLALEGPATGAAFRHIRKSMGLSAKDVAELLGLTQETVSRWEKGRRKADRRTVILLGNVFLEYLDGKSMTVDRLQTLEA